MLARSRPRSHSQPRSRAPAARARSARSRLAPARPRYEPSRALRAGRGPGDLPRPPRV